MGTSLPIIVALAVSLLFHSSAQAPGNTWKSVSPNGGTEVTVNAKPAAAQSAVPLQP